MQRAGGDVRSRRGTLGCHPPFLAHHHPTRPYQERAPESCAIPVGLQVAISRKLGCGCVRFDPPLWLPRCHTARSGEGPRLGRTAKRLSGTASGVALPHDMSREGRMGWDSMISLCGGGDAFNVPRMTRLGWIAAWGDGVQKHRVIARGVAVN